MFNSIHIDKIEIQFQGSEAISNIGILICLDIEKEQLGMRTQNLLCDLMEPKVSELSVKYSALSYGRFSLYRKYGWSCLLVMPDLDTVIQFALDHKLKIGTENVSVEFLDLSTDNVDYYSIELDNLELVDTFDGNILPYDRFSSRAQKAMEERFKLIKDTVIGYNALSQLDSK